MLISFTSFSQFYTVATPVCTLPPPTHPPHPPTHPPQRESTYGLHFAPTPASPQPHQHTNFYQNLNFYDESPRRFHFDKFTYLVSSKFLLHHFLISKRGWGGHHKIFILQFSILWTQNSSIRFIYVDNNTSIYVALVFNMFLHQI